MNRVKKWAFDMENDTALVCMRLMMGVVAVHDVCEALFDKHWNFSGPNGINDLNSRLFASQWMPSYLYTQWIPQITSYESGFILYMLMLLAGVCVFLGYHYRPAMFMLATLFSYFFFIDETQYLNHQYLIILLSWSMVLAPAAESRSLDALLSGFSDWNRPTRVPRWWRAYFQLSFSLVYLYGSWNKINRDWLMGQPLNVWLRNPRRRRLLKYWPLSEMDIMDSVVRKWWYPFVIAYGGIVWDGLAPVFIILADGWRWRSASFLALAGSLVFHLSNYFHFNIGVFPWISLWMTSVLTPGVFCCIPFVSRAADNLAKHVPWMNVFILLASTSVYLLCSYTIVHIAVGLFACVVAFYFNFYSADSNNISGIWHPVSVSLVALTPAWIALCGELSNMIWAYSCVLACFLILVEYHIGSQWKTKNPNKRVRYARKPNLHGSRRDALIFALYIVFAVAQIMIPLRASLYDSNVFYAEDGHKFTWRMMLRQRTSEAVILVDTGHEEFFDFSPDKTPIHGLEHYEMSKNGGRIGVDPECSKIPPEVDCRIQSINNDTLVDAEDIAYGALQCTKKESSEPCAERIIVGPGEPLLTKHRWNLIMSRPNLLARFMGYLKKFFDNTYCPLVHLRPCNSRIYMELYTSINYRRHQRAITMATDITNPALPYSNTGDWLEPEAPIEGFHRMQYPWVFLDPTIEDNPCMAQNGIASKTRQRAICALWWYLRGGREWWYGSTLTRDMECSVPEGGHDAPSRGWWWEWILPKDFFNDEEMIDDIQLATYWQERVEYWEDNGTQTHLMHELMVQQGLLPPSGGGHNRRVDD